MMAHYIPGAMERPWCHVSSGLWEDVDDLDKDLNYNINIEDYFQNLDISEKLSLESPTDMMLLKKEQKDAELDKKIEALRKKNEALMKRYQEVEEDKKRAEQEGMALQSRKGKVEDLTITINKSPTEKRVVTKKGSESTSPKGFQEQGEGVSAIFSSGRGKRRQLLVTTPGNTKGKRVVSERVDRRSPTSPVESKYPTEDRQELLDTTAGGRNCLNTRRATGTQVGRKQERKSRADEAHGFTECDTYLQQTELSDALHHADLDAPTSSEEQLEYLRWKREREEIDRERVARHKNSQGQWRRAWDMDKPELMFSEKVQGVAERGAQNRGGRNGRKGHLRSSPAESRGNPVRQRDKRGKNVPVVGSKAKGKDRLTGRARRWDTKMEEEQLQACPDTSLEEFLEELDALCEPEADSNTPDMETQDGLRMDASEDTKAGSQHNPTESNTETSGSKSTEKKVRFSEDLIQGASEKNTGTTETKASSLKNTSQNTRSAGEEDAHQALEHNQDGISNNQEKEVTGMLPTDVQTKWPGQEDVQENVKERPEPLEGFLESEAKEASCYSLNSQNSSNATEQELLYPVEHMKSSTTRSTEELIDSSLSVLSLESGDPLPDHSTSTDKARENGKIV
ncbi:coiled-coil domain-containing protein 9B isoform X2 [Pygocentrus nattereri]|uniref:Coiled-coil domain containing 9B n=1 Tax=Pygocentrus nattereri TaxID=42514 RepID=A0A3B4ECJ1_PYGNA|nr:coiled-coil domain-containing protein 9B isoform X2 [Pygocentrus nattereri]